MSAIWPVAMHDRSRMPELQPDLETETVHAVERMTMHAAEVTLFGRSGRRGAQSDMICAPQPVIAGEAPAVQNGGYACWQTLRLAHDA